eukprot:gene20841-26728_t
MFNAFVWGISWWPFRQLEAHGLHPLWATALIYAFSLACLLAVRPGAWRGFASQPLLWLLMAQFAFTMMTTIAGGILAVSMVADVTDQIQLETGRRSEGLLFSAATMVNKAISGMGIMLAGLLLAFV